MSLSLLIIIFLLKNIEAMSAGCGIWSSDKKIYECDVCLYNYNRVKCPDRPDDNNCFICYKCEIIYCDECTNTVCTKCLDGFYLNNNKCSFCNTNCETCSGSADNCDSCNFGYYKSNGECKKCDSNCYSCSGSAAFCTNCNYGYYLDSSNSCVQCVSHV